MEILAINSLGEAGLQIFLTPNGVSSGNGLSAPVVGIAALLEAREGLEKLDV